MYMTVISNPSALSSTLLLSNIKKKTEKPFYPMEVDGWWSLRCQALCPMPFVSPFFFVLNPLHLAGPQGQLNPWCLWCDIKAFMSQMFTSCHSPSSPLGRHSPWLWVEHEWLRRGHSVLDFFFPFAFLLFRNMLMTVSNSCPYNQY